MVYYLHNSTPPVQASPERRGHAQALERSPTTRGVGNRTGPITPFYGRPGQGTWRTPLVQAGLKRLNMHRPQDDPQPHVVLAAVRVTQMAYIGDLPSVGS